MLSLRKGILLCVFAAFFATLPALAQSRAMWQSASTTARSITGDVSLTDAKVTLNFLSFPIGEVRKLTPAEAASVFDIDSNAPATATLYRLAISGRQKFMRGNTLCGSADVEWMVSYITPDAKPMLWLAFFSGARAPVFTHDAVANSSDLCGTFNYVR